MVDSSLLQPIPEPMGEHRDYAVPKAPTRSRSTGYSALRASVARTRNKPGRRGTLLGSLIKSRKPRVTLDDPSLDLQTGSTSRLQKEPTGLKKMMSRRRLRNKEKSMRRIGASKKDNLEGLMGISKLESRRSQKVDSSLVTGRRVASELKLSAKHDDVPSSKTERVSRLSVTESSIEFNLKRASLIDRHASFKMGSVTEDQLPVDGAKPSRRSRLRRSSSAGELRISATRSVSVGWLDDSSLPTGGGCRLQEERIELNMMRRQLEARRELVMKRWLEEQQKIASGEQVVENNHSWWDITAMW